MMTHRWENCSSARATAGKNGNCGLRQQDWGPPPSACGFTTQRKNEVKSAPLCSAQAGALTQRLYEQGIRYIPWMNTLEHHV